MSLSFHVDKNYICNYDCSIQTTQITWIVNVKKKESKTNFMI